MMEIKNLKIHVVISNHSQRANKVEGGKIKEPFALKKISLK